MKIRNTIVKLLIAAAGVAAIAAIESDRTQRTAAATETNRRQLALASDPAGFVCGQTLRVNVFNSNAPEVQGSARLVARVKLFDASGVVVAQSPEVELPAGQFRSFDFKRDDLLLPGEPETKRLQVRCGLQASWVDGSSSALPESLAASLEVIENRTGKASYLTGSVGWVKVSLD
jgi:hypothetical protein